MRDAIATLKWADGTYTFRLGWGELIQLQEVCNAGPYEILKRLNLGTWKVQEISSVIRLGLIGGGLEPAKALNLVEFYVEGRPPLENLIFAQGILSVGLQGAPDEPPGKPDAAAEPPQASE